MTTRATTEETMMTMQTGRGSTMAMAHPETRRRTGNEARTIEPSRRPESVSPQDRRVQIAAAKARVALDSRLGVPTEDWIVALSQEKPE